MKAKKILKTYVLKRLVIDTQTEEPSEENGWTYNGTRTHYKDHQHRANTLVAFITDNGRYVLAEMDKAQGDYANAYDFYKTETELMKDFYHEVARLKSKEYWATEFDMFPPADDDIPCEIKVPRLLKLDNWSPNGQHHHYTCEWSRKRYSLGNAILEEIEPFTAHYKPTKQDLIQGSLL